MTLESNELGNADFSFNFFSNAIKEIKCSHLKL